MDMDVTFTYYGKTETRDFGGTSQEGCRFVVEEDEHPVGTEGEVATHHGVVIVGKLGFIINKEGASTRREGG
ncbi:hypothetical protein GW17_00014116 [Ensete ventricosum]|nr:hypothetical protein GW17_00014116 [Ensete ventricosum]